MAKIVRHLRDSQVEFQKVFANLCDTKSSWQVWSDFVEMTAIAISNRFEIRADVKQKREQRYHDIIGQYKKSEQAVFPELVAILIQALEREPEQDFLGEMFMALELGSHWKGQFFTPYSICKMMSQVNLNTEDAKGRVEKNGWFSVCDPACGAGATLIAARNHLALAGIGSTQAFFVGQDIDRTAAMMCYVQLSLLGCAGYVVVADSLIHPVTGRMLWPNLTEYQDAWFMPQNFTDPVWVLRWMKSLRTGKDYEDATDTSCHETATAEQVIEEKETPQEAVQEPPAPPAPELFLKETEIGQLTLF